jgi:hypothetical protein
MSWCVPAAQIAVPEEALFVKESSAKPKSAFPGVIKGEL